MRVGKCLAYMRLHAAHSSMKRLGGCMVIDPDAAIEEAVSLATTSDAVIYVGGLTPEWELEGFDRPTLHLPCRQDELIEKLGRANKNTVVILQAVSSRVL
jgi:beta-glucosidase